VLLLLLVHVLAEIHDAAHRRGGGSGDFDEIEVELEREGDGLRRIHDPELAAFGADHANLRRLDPHVAPDCGEGIVVATVVAVIGRAAAGRRGRKCHSVGLLCEVGSGDGFCLLRRR